jgi:2-dehydro-3-deoxyphosphogluconate aldolase/(4S)-4-hydroxy-2-oxoglutarate aldolase
VVKRAAELGMPFVPGIATPSEVEEALELGCKHLKFFPAEACGGLAMLKGLSAPYKHTGVQFVPTGGVKQSNLTDYLSIETVAAVGGTWIATQEDIATGNWAEVTRKCRDARAVVQQLRD